MIEYLSLKKITELYEPDITRAAEDVIKSGFYLYGKQVKSFEREFADYCGVSNCVGVANGLDALTLILVAYKKLRGWNDDDEVIVSANTFAATFLAVLRARLRPVACDVNESDGLINADLLEGLITPHTRAIIPVQLYGAVCDMDRINEIAAAHGIVVVEDAAQAHGAVYNNGRRAGSLGDAAAFSFYPSKNLGALSDAGAVVTDDERLAHTVRIIANYGSEIKYHHTMLGINSRIDDIQSAILRIKLKRLDETNACRRRIAAVYQSGIDNSLVSKPYGGELFNSVYYVYPVFCKERDRLQQYLLDCGIKTLIHYPVPPHLQPALKPFLADAKAPVTERLCTTELSVPLNAALSEDEIEHIVRTINSFRL